MGGHLAVVGVGVIEEGPHGLIGRGVAATAEVFGLQLAAARAMGTRHPATLAIERCTFNVTIEIIGGLGLGR